MSSKIAGRYGGSFRWIRRFGKPSGSRFGPSAAAPNGENMAQSGSLVDAPSGVAFAKGASMKSAAINTLTLLSLCLGVACSGPFVSLDEDAPLVTYPDPSSTVRPPVRVPPYSPTDDGPRGDGGSYPDGNGNKDGQSEASVDAALDRLTPGCVEPEPNGSATTALTLPFNFTCGRLSDGADVDYFVRRAAPGETAYRVLAPGDTAGASLVVTVSHNGSVFVLGRNDTFVATAGEQYLFQVRSADQLATDYGILVGN